MLYATYARGFKSGGLNLPAFGPVDTVRPEILDDFGIGWKVQTDAIRFNGAAFYYKYNDFIGDSYMPCGEVAGLSATTPAEIAGKALAVAGCAGQGGAGLALVGGRDLSGNRLVNSPKFSGYIRASYTHPLDNAGSITVGSILNHRSLAYFDVANRFKDKARTMLSGSLVWTSANEKYTVGVFGENLTNRRYTTINQPQNTGGWLVQALGREVLFRVGVKY